MKLSRISQRVCRHVEIITGIIKQWEDRNMMDRLLSTVDGKEIVRSCRWTRGIKSVRSVFSTMRKLWRKRLVTDWIEWDSIRMLLYRSPSWNNVGRDVVLFVCDRDCVWCVVCVTGDIIKKSTWRAARWMRYEFSIRRRRSAKNSVLFAERKIMTVLWRFCVSGVVVERCDFFEDTKRVVGTCRDREECKTREGMCWQCALRRQTRERDLSKCDLASENEKHDKLVITVFDVPKNGSRRLVQSVEDVRSARRCGGIHRGRRRIFDRRWSTCVVMDVSRCVFCAARGTR